MKTLLKVVIALVALTVVAVLFVRSARSTRAQPFTIARQHLAGWSPSVGADGDPLGSALGNRAQGGVDAAGTARSLCPYGRVAALFHPTAMPVVLRSEFERALAGVLTPQALLAAAQEGGPSNRRRSSHGASPSAGSASRGCTPERLLPLVRGAAVQPVPHPDCRATGRRRP